YPSPMWTGSAVQDSPHDGLPSARVSIPAAWDRLANTVNAEPGAGKVVVLPVNLYFYAFATTWRYSGVDVIPSELLKRPTLHLLPGGYFKDLPSVQAMLIGAQNDLLTGNGDGWRGRLRALGADTVIVRHDLVRAPIAANSPLSADPGALDAALGRIGNMRPDGDFGVASLYHLRDPAGTVSVGTGLTGVYGPDPASVAQTTAALPPGNSGVTDPDQPVDAFRAAIVDPGTVRFALRADGVFRIDRGGTDATYRVTATGNRLTLSDADTVAVDGRRVPDRPALAVDLAQPRTGVAPDVVGLDVDGNLRVLPPAGDAVVLGPGTAVTAYAVQSRDGLSGPFRRAEDCSGQPDGAADPNPLRLAVASGQQCAVAPVRPTATAVYRVHFLFRNKGGAKARLCLWQDGPAACALLPAPPAASDWAEYTAVTRLAPDIPSARLYLYADASAGRGVAEFRDVMLTPLDAVGAALLSPLPAPETDLALVKGRHTITVDRYPPAPVNDLSEVSPCTLGGPLYPRYPTGNRQHLQPDGSLSLSAPKKGVCAETAVLPVVPGATYRLSADYRSDFGQTAKICLREDPSERCADLPALTRVAQWQTVRALVRPDFGTTAIRSQFSAGESELVPSLATYRNIRLIRVSTVSVSAAPVDPPVSWRPTVTSTAVTPAEYRVVVHGAAGRFTVVLRDSYAPGWSLDGLPAGWSARHLTVDGYANGWLVEGTGDAVLTARYRPERWASAALTISLVAGAAAVALVIGGWLLKNGRWRAALP
ncbi:MAG TPA: hypothetical protein VEL30_00120, partial [Candidatus Nitrosopolaris sp.]|nr:hypothetical protein [Candidatus Nitrosopolaris sp.]